MSKTSQQYIDFVKEIKTVCQKHDIGMIGTCMAEGILGEIFLFELSDASPEDIAASYNFQAHGAPVITD